MTSFTKSSSDDVVRRVAGGVTLRLKVTPGARRERIEGLVPAPDGGRALKLSVTAAPERGRANDAAIALLARALGVPKSSLSVVAGETSRLKTIRIAGEPATLAQLLEQHRASWKKAGP